MQSTAIPHAVSWQPKLGLSVAAGRSKRHNTSNDQGEAHNGAQDQDHYYIENQPTEFNEEDMYYADPMNYDGQASEFQGQDQADVGNGNYEEQSEDAHLCNMIGFGKADGSS